MGTKIGGAVAEIDPIPLINDDCSELAALDEAEEAWDDADRFGVGKCGEEIPLDAINPGKQVAAVGATEQVVDIRHKIARAIECDVKGRSMGADCESDRRSELPMGGNQAIERKRGENVAIVNEQRAGFQPRQEIAGAAAGIEQDRLMEEIESNTLEASAGESETIGGDGGWLCRRARPTEIFPTGGEMVGIDGDPPSAEGGDPLECVLDQRAMEERNQRLWHERGEWTQTGAEACSGDECLVHWAGHDRAALDIQACWAGSAEIVGFSSRNPTNLVRR